MSRLFFPPPEKFRGSRRMSWRGKGLRARLRAFRPPGRRAGRPPPRGGLPPHPKSGRRAYLTLRVKPRSCPPDRGNGRAGAFGRTASPDGLAFGSRVPPGRRQKSPIGDPASKTPDSSRSYFRYSRSGRADRPGGTHDFSPAIHRWDAVASPSLPCVPEGRARRRRRGQLCGGEEHSPVSCSLPPRPGPAAAGRLALAADHR